MNKTACLLKILIEKGLYTIKQSDNKSISGSITLVDASVDSNGTLYDIYLDIMDADTDYVILEADKDTLGFVLHLARIILQEHDNVYILLSELEQSGIIMIHGRMLRMIRKLDEFDTELEILPSTECIKQILRKFESNPQQELAMKHGFDSFMTGNYYIPSLFSGIKHVSLLEGTTLDFEKVSPDIMNANSAFIFQTQECTDEFYSSKISNFDISLASHIHQVSNDKVKFDGGEAIDIEIIPYAEYSNIGDKLVYLSIKDKKDLERLRDDLQSYSCTGIIKPIGAKLINSCSWSNSFCTLSKLTRVQLGNENVVIPCKYSSQTIGTIEEPLFSLIRKASQKMSKQSIERNCSSCSAYNYCSKCALLPDEILTSDFCDIMKKHPLLPDYVNKIALFSEMIQTSNLFGQGETFNIEISNAEHPLVYIDSDAKKYKQNTFFTAFLYNYDYYVITYASPKIIRTDDRFIFIAEAFAREVPIDDIYNKYSNKYDIILKDAIEHVNEAAKMIHDGSIQ